MGRAVSYETRVVLILGLAWALVSVEVFGINYIIPFIQPELKLTNTQIGTLTACFWITYSISTFFAGAVAERIGGRRKLLVLTLGTFAFASVSSAFAHSFATLLAARMMMGFLAGPVLPLAHAILALESSSARRGLNMGLVQSVGGNILAGLAAPFVLVYIASHFSWRNSFFLVGLPCLACAYFIFRFVREPLQGEVAQHDAEALSSAGGGLAEAYRSRNVWLCTLAGAFVIGYSAIAYGFMPLYQIRIRDFSPQQMATLMGVLGIAAVVYGVIVPALSDRIGRKLTIMIGNALAMLSPLVLIYGPPSVPLIGTILFLSWSGPATFPLLCGTVPSESVSSRAMSKAIGAIMAFSTIVGGVGVPFIAGRSADAFGLTAPLIVMLSCAIGAILCGLAMRETLPKKVRSAQAAAA